MKTPDDWLGAADRRRENAERDARRFIAISMIVNSALYLTAVFVAGLLRGNDIAWKGAIFTFGLCYVAALVQALPGGQRFGYIFLTTTIFIGLMAGLALLYW